MGLTTKHNSTHSEFVGTAVEGYVIGPLPNESYLVLVQPVETYDVEKRAIVGITRGIQWWEPGTPFYNKVVNTGSETGKISNGHPVGKVIALNASDPDRFQSSVDPAPVDHQHSETSAPTHGINILLANMVN